MCFNSLILSRTQHSRVSEGLYGAESRDALIHASVRRIHRKKCVAMVFTNDRFPNGRGLALGVADRQLERDGKQMAYETERAKCYRMSELVFACIFVHFVVSIVDKCKHTVTVDMNMMHACMKRTSQLD